MEQLELFYTAGTVTGLITLENCLAASIKAQHVCILGLATCLFLCPIEMRTSIYQDTDKMFIAELFVITSNWKPPTCPSEVERINIACSRDGIVTGMNKLQPYATAQMNVTEH